jgi:hypothetical protein
MTQNRSELAGFSRFRSEVKSVTFVGLQCYSAAMRAIALCQLRIPRSTATLAPGEEPARDACKWWTPDGGVARNGEEMTERKLSATDAALRERITELSVHIPCGRIRGPVGRVRSGAYVGWPGKWQSCPDEDSPERRTSKTGRTCPLL